MFIENKSQVTKSYEIMSKIYFLLSLLLMLSLASCGSYGYVRLDYPQKPMVVLPEGINNIVVLNRSLTKEEDKRGEVLESIATGEIAGSDKLASDEAIKGAFDGLQNKSHLNIVIPDTLRIYGTGTRQMPDKLNWERVASICKLAQADALLVLETFDSNSNILRSAIADQVSSVMTTGKPNLRLPSRVRVDVKSYWRLYDPVTKSISDHFQQTYYMDFDLVNDLPPVNALHETAYAAGLDYVSRFLPGYYRVKRDMYKKGKGKDKRLFDRGWRSTEVARWKEAIEIWREIAEDTNSKSAGRAALNIAVAYEVLGETNLALQWAQQAYRDYGDKLGRDYSKTLLRRRNLEF